MGGVTSTAASTSLDANSSQLPVARPYDFGALKSSLLRGRLPDDDSIKLLSI